MSLTLWYFSSSPPLSCFQNYHEMFLVCGTFMKWECDDVSLFLDCQTWVVEDIFVFSGVPLSSTDGQRSRSSQWDAVLAPFFPSFSFSFFLSFYIRRSFFLWPRGRGWVRLMCVYSSSEKWRVVCVCNGFPFFSTFWPIPCLPCIKLVLRFSHTRINNTRFLSWQFPVDKYKRVFCIWERDAESVRKTEASCYFLMEPFTDAKPHEAVFFIFYCVFSSSRRA